MAQCSGGDAAAAAVVVVVVDAENTPPTHPPQPPLPAAETAAGDGKAAARGEAPAAVVVDVAGLGGGVVSDEGSGRESQAACRICHLSPDRGEKGAALFHLGCGCKGDLGIAHRHCAEAWFRVKGNRFCEICGANAKNITGEDDSKFMDEWYERGEMSNQTSSERCGCWRRQTFCNFLMACLVIAFILPWFLRVNMF